MQFKQTIAATFLTALMANANAASMSLIYVGEADVIDGTVQALVGDIVTFDVHMDFTDEPTIGGGFDLYFDAAGLAFENYDVADFGNPIFAQPPDVTDGLLVSGGFGAIEGLSGPATVGTVSFAVIDSGVFSLDLAGSGHFGFVSAEDFVTEILVDYGGATIVAVVPLPAAVWFMLSGLCALFGLRRRKSR